MNKKIKNFVIIGNGMDIDHGVFSNWYDIFPSDYMNTLFEESNKVAFLKKFIDKDAYHKSILWSDFENMIREMEADISGAFTSKKDAKDKNSVREEIILNFNNFIYQNKRKIVNVFKKAKDEIEIENMLLKIMETDPVICKWQDVTFKIKQKLFDFIEKANSDNYFRVFNCVFTNGNKLMSEKNKKYFDLINSFGSYFVLNYNYTNFYEGEERYYTSGRVFHPHGKLARGKGCIFNACTCVDKEQIINSKHSLNGDIHNLGLGFYNSKNSISKDKVLQKYLKSDSFSREQMEKIINSFREFLGDTNIFFRKSKLLFGEPISAFDKYKKIHDFSNIKRVTILGHSMNDIDFEPLFWKWDSSRNAWDKNGEGRVDFSRVNHVTYVGHWKFSADEEKILQTLKKYFPKPKSFKLINNFQNTN